jgi:hypothetical protein
MATDRRYKVIDMSPDPGEATWTSQVEDVLNEQAERDGNS